MFNNYKSAALFILILSSLSLAALTFNPQLQKSYFSIAPHSPFSYEFPQTRNGNIIAHYFDSQSSTGPDSRYVLFNITSGDAYPVLQNTESACKIASPFLQHIHYHLTTDTLVYYCAKNSSLLFINQADHTVQSAISLNISQPLPVAKLSTDGMNINILAMDTLFNENPRSSILVKINMQSKQAVSQVMFNQNLPTGEAVVAYAPGSKASYVATHIWHNTNHTLNVSIYLFNTTGNTYQIIPVTHFIGSSKAITKLCIVGDYIVLNLEGTVMFLNNIGKLVQFASIATKKVTDEVSHPAFVLSNDGKSLYVHEDHSVPVHIFKFTINGSNMDTDLIAMSQDMQIALANKDSNDLIFTYDTTRPFFNIADLQTRKNILTTISSYDDLILTNATYTVVVNSAFYVFNLKTDALVRQVTIPQSKYYYNKDQHIVTFLQAPLNTSCEVTHLDLASGKLWTTLNLTADLCPSNVSFARMTEKGNSEVVIPGNKSYLIVSETYGQLVVNTSSPTHDTDSINVNFDDLSFYYYTANQVLKQINASYYTFNPQSKSFQPNSTKLLNLRPVESHGFFTLNQNLTVALSDSTFTLLNQLDSQWFNVYANHFNLVTSFEDQSGTPHIFFSYVSDNYLYPPASSPALYNSSGAAVSIPGRRASTVSGQATGPRSFALYDAICMGTGVVRFFNSDPQASKTLISI